MSRSPARLTFGVLALALAAACTERTPTSVGAPAVQAPALSAVPVPTSDPWLAQYEGTSGQGSRYALFMPKSWNGDVIYYAHGILPPQAPVVLPTDGDNADQIRDALGALGYAVAYSSWSENGYAWQDGLQYTNQLRGLFTAKFGTAQRSWLLGMSLGSQVVQALAERDGAQYSGALAMCGVLGGTRAELDYIANVRTLFDFYYPSLLPGNTLDVGSVSPADLPSLQNAALGAVIANPTPFQTMLAIDQVAPLRQGIDGAEMLGNLWYALSYQLLGVGDVLDRTHGHSMFDNSAPDYYTSSLLPAPYMALVNSTVTHYTATPDALAWMQNNYQPTGNLRIPMLTLHNQRDPLVPYFHEALYAGIVAAAGRSSLLVQRPVDAWGHCDRFAIGDVVGAFQDLVQWVASGVPATP